MADGVDKHFFEHANDDQITFYPQHLLKGKIDQMTHIISIIADADKHALQDIDAKKISAKIHAQKEYKEQRRKKELEGKMTRVF